MGKRLAIRGHSTRGKEVIEILEMMGGKNNCDSPADNLGLCYLIDDEFDICAHYFGYDDYEDGELTIFTLEEFLDKYPFKVGDKVVYTKFGDNCDDYPVTIESMKWMGTTIEYTFNDCVTCLAKDLKMWEEKSNEVISGIYLNSCDYADEVELNLGDYEIEVRDGKTYAVKKKPKYPKTYVECCKVLGISYRAQLSYTNPEVECSNIYLTKEKHLLDTFMKLRICRNAYWKIAGEELELDKPWEPNEDSMIAQYGIRPLLFPSKEIYNMFYDNFKDLIEQCKELL